MSTEGRRPLYARVDPAKCCGYTLCAEICPEVFKLDEAGFSSAPDEVVPLGLEDKAREAAAACPESAIYVGEEPPGAS